MVIRRNERVLVCGINLVINPGQVVRLEGENGIGKSTFLKSLFGLYQNWTGTLSWQGRQTRGLLDVARTHLVTEKQSIKLALTVKENLLQWVSKGTEAKVKAALDKFGIGHLLNVQSQYLSAGQKRSVVLARLLMSEADIWLLDEPNIFLDTQRCEVLDSHIESFTKRGGVALIVTHKGMGVKDVITLNFHQ